MKKNKFSCLSVVCILMALYSGGTAQAQVERVVTFIHPAVLNTAASLDFIRTEAGNSASSRFADYNNTVLAYINSNPLPGSFPAVVHAQANFNTPTEARLKGDAILAYAIALRWARTGDAKYAVQARNILDGWASHFQSFDVINQPNGSPTEFRQTYLEAAWAAPGFVAAAEIIRYYTIKGQGAGWPSAQQSQFESFLNNLMNNYINHIPEVGFNNNWDVSAGYAKMAIGVYLNSQTVYQNGVDIIKAVLPLVITADGTVVELCSRGDCHHFQYSLTGLSYAAEIARIQGDNSIYTANSNRLSAGYDYMRRAYNNQITCKICSGAAIYPGVEVANRYYHTTNTQSLRNTAPPYGIPDICFLGFTTYTHYNVPY
ncbi:MAG: alginate lyase family protein [Pedobacter sp.]|uniref:alginate lyase family protein n=1 Tax=Pedobacter sp. TaxID=1411316 RepID=UPI0033987617